MIDVERYIKNGSVRVEQIALAIKYREIKGADIDLLVADKRIRAAYYGKNYQKRPKSEWDEKYLDVLSYAAVAEVFTEEYMRYLDKVAEYVTQKASTAKKMNLFIKAAIAAVATGALVLIFMNITK